MQRFYKLSALGFLFFGFTVVAHAEQNNVKEVNEKIAITSPSADTELNYGSRICKIKDGKKVCHF
ncbi:hypothetical protein FKD06_25525 [Serratia sp. SRS-8-S-2018]|uniref:hypothetical protein n=1 Tax=Serratia sp. SRS-8-S-2018 TaxID=2591107 RepID=UPI0011403208|nr:hypothetical protein [Serratia sp. SRS-8-S-2018]TPW37692.1 hypothetical protein FKD06_25525 [Serratia sp. SRS-8-S-2018]